MQGFKCKSFKCTWIPCYFLDQEGPIYRLITQKMPTAWQTYFNRCFKICQQQLDAGQHLSLVIELVQLVLEDQPTSCRFSVVGPAPLSYISLKQAVKSLCFFNKAIENMRELCRLLGIDIKLAGGGTSFTNLLDIPAKLRTKLKPKKLHEVGRLCDLIGVLLAHRKSKCAEEINNVVDIGAGIGHLSRMFSLIKNLDVTTIEGNSQFVAKSKAIDQMFMDKVAGNSWRAPQRQETYIQHTQHIDVLRRDYGREAPHVVVGLHSCGDLSTTILRYFVENSSAKVLISVGCCYHKLNAGADKPFMDVYEGQYLEPTNLPGYPMSKKYKDVNLSYASREMASFSKNSFLRKLQEDKASKILSIHIYRAALEYLILGCPEPSQLNPAKNQPELHLINPQLRHQGLSKVKNASKIEFSHYIKEALKNQPDLLDNIQKNSHKGLAKVNSLLKEEGSKLVVMIALRLILAPLIEAIVLEDRKEYLREHHLSCCAVPLFEPSVSPRNIVLISFK